MVKSVVDVLESTTLPTVFIVMLSTYVPLASVDYSFIVTIILAILHVILTSFLSTLLVFLVMHTASLAKVMSKIALNVFHLCFF